MTAIPHTPCDVLAGTLSQLFICSQSGEYTKIRTPYLYPDGDLIELFLRPNPNGVGGTVSDMGETVRWLRSQTASITRRTPKQATLIGDICLTHSVEFFKGMLQARYANNAEMTDAVTRVAQAAIRVSDLSMSFRNRGVESVVAEVEDFLIEMSISHQKWPGIPGRSGTIWTPHFQTRTALRSSMVHVLATGSRSAARIVRDHAVAMWFDLSNLKVASNPIQFVSLFDDTADVWSGDDFRLISEVSDVARWSEPEEVAQMLGAAA
jgi:hypothetical protein